MIPSALDCVQEIAGHSDRLGVFLDYDGTLTPIISHPQDAWLTDSMRQTLRELAGSLPVAVLSGRDLHDVRRRVDIDGIVYAGSHGFDIAGAGGLRHTIATSTKTTLSGLRWLWTQWQQDIVNCAELTGKKCTNCCLASSGTKAKP